MNYENTKSRLFIKVRELITKRFRGKYFFNRIKSLFQDERGTVIISEIDYYKILMAAKHKRIRHAQKKYTRKVKRLLKISDVRPFRLVPRNLITMNSEFSVKTGRGKILNLKLVYPDQEDRTAGRISIFSRLGVCLLGKRQGDRIKNNLIHQIIYQPEENRDFL